MPAPIRNWEFRGTQRFQIVRRLGAGGMGIVYEAFDREAQTSVALKALKNPSPEPLMRFKREFRALQDIQHPNLVSLGELIEESGVWFFTMDLLRGVSFLAYVRGCAESEAEAPEGAGFDEARLRDALAQLARGLQTLHGAGKIHRDIKPSNVLVSSTGHVSLLDFGLVLDATSGVDLSDEQVVGTAVYSAPEQAASGQVGPASDWYSVGVMLYEALVGAPPFSGAPLRILMEKQKREPEPPRARSPDVPADLDALCAALLHYDPSARPPGEKVLRVLGVEEARDAAIAIPPSTVSLSPQFVGRVAELELLRAAYEASREGRAVAAVYVEGVSGVGKTALVRQFTQLLASEGDAVVFAGRCHERESVPYKAFDGIVDALARYLQRLPVGEAASLVPREAALLPAVFPILRKVDVLARAPRESVLDRQELRTRVFAALRELLGLLAATRPVILVVDDLQWADADSMGLLNELVRPPDAPPLLLVAMARPLEEGLQTARAGIADLAIEVRRMELCPLRSEEARALAIELLRRSKGESPEAEEAARGIAEEARGHPLFIDELVRRAALGTEAGLTAGGQQSALRLEEALWARILQLDDEARRLLELVSISGAPVAKESVAHALGIGLAELNRHASLLRVMNLARTTGARASDRIETYHDRVRAAVLEQLDEEVAREHHAMIARGLEASASADPEALSFHLRAAGQADNAATYAAAAADQAASALAFDRAARLYRVALELCPARDAHALRVALGDALANAGRGAEAAEAYLASVDEAQAAEALDLQRRAAQQLLVTGHTDEGLAALQAVLQSQGMRYPKTSRRALLAVIARRVQLRLRGLRFRVRDETEVSASDLARIDVCFHAGIGLSVVDTIRGNAFHGLGFLLALRAGEPYRLARALAIEGAFLGTLGGPARRRADKLLRSAEDLAHALENDHARGLVTGCRGAACFLRGAFRDAVHLCDEAVVIFRDRCAGVPWELVSAKLFAARSLYHLGELEELGRRVPRAIQESRDRGDLYGETTLRATVLPFLLLAQDNASEAAEVARHSLDRWSSRGFQIQHYYQLSSHCAADLYAGRAPRAIDHLHEKWSDLKRALHLRVQFVRISLYDLRARSLLFAAQTSPAEKTGLLRQAESDRRRIARENMDWSNPVADMLSACAAQIRGESERAVARFAAAAAGFDAADMALHAAVARKRQGEIIGGDEGETLVRAAEEWMSGHEIASPQRMAGMLAPLLEQGQSGIERDRS